MQTIIATLVSLVLRLPPGVRTAGLSAFLRVPPQLRAAGATAALYAAAQAAHANGQPEIAALLAICGLLGLVIEIAVLPVLRQALADEDRDGTPDVLERLNFRLPPGITWTDVRLVLGHIQRVGLERALEAVMRLPSRQAARPPAPPSVPPTMLVLLVTGLALSGCGTASALCGSGIDVERFGAEYGGSPAAPLELAQTTVELDVCGLPLTVETFATIDDVTVCVVAPLVGRACDSMSIGGSHE